MRSLRRGGSPAAAPEGCGAAGLGRRRGGAGGPAAAPGAGAAAPARSAGQHLSERGAAAGAGGVAAAAPGAATGDSGPGAARSPPRRGCLREARLERFRRVCATENAGDMASLRLLLLLLLAQRGLGAAAGRGRAPGVRQPIYNHIKSRDPPPAPRSRSPESTILAQRLADEVPQDVASFLYTGDSRELRRANCSGRYELASLAGKSRFVSHPSLHGALDTLTHATNFLNMILQSNKSREQNLQEDLEWYRALIRSLLEGDPNISRAAITFSTEPFSAPQVFLQASRHENQIHLQDLSSSAHRLANGSLETEWFQGLKRKWRPHQHRKVLNTGSKTLENSWKRREGFTADKNHIRWSSPYLECENGNYKPGWLVTLSAAFYGLQPNLVPEFRYEEGSSGVLYRRGHGRYSVLPLLGMVVMCLWGELVTLSTCSVTPQCKPRPSC